VVLARVAAGSICHHVQLMHRPQLDILLPIVLSFVNQSH
jgi:hypothetical protein